MSHGKMTKRGVSRYIESWNPSAKKYICACALCGKKGYSPVIEEESFRKKAENGVIYRELTKTLSKIELDERGLCSVCVKTQDE